MFDRYKKCNDKLMSEGIKSKIRSIPDWPKRGIIYRDITTLLKDPEAMKHTCTLLRQHFEKKDFDKIAGIESRGFIFSSILAHQLSKGLIIIRKLGKLPADTISEKYKLEYGTDTLEIHKDAVDSGDNVVLVDDLLATGGTMHAACRLVEKLGGRVAGCAFVVELPELRGREMLKNYEIFNLVEFGGA